MQTRRIALQQGFAQTQSHIQAEGADGVEVFAVTFEARCDPARDLGPQPSEKRASCL